MSWLATWPWSWPWPRAMAMAMAIALAMWDSLGRAMAMAGAWDMGECGGFLVKNSDRLSLIIKFCYHGLVNLNDTFSQVILFFRRE